MNFKGQETERDRQRERERDSSVRSGTTLRANLKEKTRKKRNGMKLRSRNTKGISGEILE